MISIYYITLNTGERYVSLIHPLQYLSIMTGQRILRVVACMWTISLCIALVQLSWLLPFGFFRSHHIKFTAYLVYNFIGFGLCFVIPFLIMVVAYIQMFITIHRQAQKIKRQMISLDSHSTCFRVSHTQLRALLTFALMLGLFAGSWVTWYISLLQLYVKFSFLSRKTA